MSPRQPAASAPVLLLLLLSLASLGGCRKSTAEQPVRLRLATTTSTENSGLLDRLLPAFEERNACTVDVIAVGTGQALRLGRGGDVDAVMVHAPDLERRFVDDGFGVHRRTFMQNDFVLLGPRDDPAAVRGAPDVSAAMAAIAGARAPFVSRGDESGTHHRERGLWTAAGIEPAGAWYLEAGQGMGAVLTMASDKGAYTLSDRGTFLSHARELDLEVVHEGGGPLLNPYSAIAVDPARFDWVRHDLAIAFIDWLCGDEARAIIGGFEVGGETLFEPLDCEGS